MRFQTALRTLTATLILSSAASAQAAWKLDSDVSQLSFQTTKMAKSGASTVETDAFTSWRARVNDAGQLSVEIDLDSASTGIDIRDQRVSEKLFESGTYPLAVMTASLDMPTLKVMEPGDTQQVDIEGQLTLHDNTQNLPVSLQVTRLRGDRWLVQTLTPVMVDAEQFALVDGIRTLRDLAGLGNIATQVPVNVKAVMVQED
ncbi:YceI family protein [Cobetia sp. MB87]|uniref:YceI family protein n=1 Tax=Cobetia sp. MB87 TaxID=2588451 RepID=UPI0014077276|nr:YceI family protein [Cobetia sp. MB87]NHH86623.1 hypothetical protein [Cobetia sp. MB87]